jgi:hypothetical protein
MVEADPMETDPHSCQPPLEDPPPVGGEWICPECGTRWRLEDAQQHPENLPAQREQRINWVQV